MILRQIILLAVTAILTGLAVSSCSDSKIDPLVPEPGEIPDIRSVMLSLSPVSMSQLTRAVYPEHSAEPGELIQEWYIAIIDVTTETVVAVERGRDLPESGVWNDVVNTKLELFKKYTAFAFANFKNATSLNGEEQISYKNSADFAQNFLNLKVGEKVKIGDILEKVYTDGKDLLKENDLIPMAGYLDFTPQGTVNEVFSIEVVRLYSRVEFAFVKNVDPIIRINEISLGDVNTGSIVLMPDYTNKPIPNENPDKDPEIPDNSKYVSVIYTPASRIEVPDDGDGDVSLRTRFYIKESVVNDDNRFKIGINLTRGTGKKAITETVEVLTNSDLKSFYRNDYVLFPITFNNTPEIKVYDYPPIGGYPVQVEANGTEYTAMFSSSGAFDIETSIVDKNGNVIELGSEGNGNTNYVEWNTADKPAGFNISYDSVSKRWFGDFPLGYDEPIRIDFKFHVGDLVYSRSLTLIGRK